MAVIGILSGPSTGGHGGATQGSPPRVTTIASLSIPGVQPRPMSRSSSTTTTYIFATAMPHVRRGSTLTSNRGSGSRTSNGLTESSVNHGTILSPPQVTSSLERKPEFESNPTSSGHDSTSGGVVGSIRTPISPVQPTHTSSTTTFTTTARLIMIQPTPTSSTTTFTTTASLIMIGSILTPDINSGSAIGSLGTSNDLMGSTVAVQSISHPPQVTPSSETTSEFEDNTTSFGGDSTLTIFSSVPGTISWERTTMTSTFSTVPSASGAKNVDKSSLNHPWIIGAVVAGILTLITISSIIFLRHRQQRRFSNRISAQSYETNNVKIVMIQDGLTEPNEKRIHEDEAVEELLFHATQRQTSLTARTEETLWAGTSNSASRSSSPDLITGSTAPPSYREVEN